jgi:hypothetical protein
MTWTLIRSRSAAAVLFGLLAFGLASTVAGGSLQAGLARGAELADAIAIRSPGARLDALLSTVKERRSSPKRIDQARPRTSKLAGESVDDNLVAQLPGDKGTTPGLSPTIDDPLLATSDDFPGTVGIAPAIGPATVFATAGPMFILPPGPGTPRPGDLSRPPAVPEPGAWVMLIAGFAALGSRMRCVGVAAREQRRADAASS